MTTAPSTGAGGLPRTKRWVAGTTLLLLTIEITAVLTGRMSFGAAVVGLLVAETALVVVVLVTGLLRARQYDALPWPDRWQAGLAEVLPEAVAGLMAGELRMLHSVYLFIGRRTAVEHCDDTPLPPARGRASLLIAFAVVAGIELLAVDLLVPWERLGSLYWVRWLVLAASVYGLLWVLAWLAAERTHPHLATADALVVRSGPWTVARIPWGVVVSIDPGRRNVDDDHRLILDVPMSVPNLHLELRRPVPTVRAFGRPGPRHGRVSLTVEDATAAAQEIRHRLEQLPPDSERSSP